MIRGGQGRSLEEALNDSNGCFYLIVVVCVLAIAAALLLL